MMDSHSHIVPPPLPSLGDKPEPRPRHGLFPKFEERFTPLPGKFGPLRMIESLLKQPAGLVYEVNREHRTTLALGFTLIALLCVAAYGFVVGTFSGGAQLWAAPVKAVGGLAFGSLICFPSLYIFLCLQGGRHSIAETATLLSMALALGGLLLVGLAPIAWIFAQSTHAISFMGIMHLLFIGIALVFGLGLLRTAFTHLNGRELGALRIWVPIFVIVLCQVTTMLRPVIGPHEAVWGDKLFFLAHWWQIMGG